MGELFVFLLALLCWIYFRLRQANRALVMEKEQFKNLNADYLQLKATLKTRGARLDVLLSSVTEVVLRVDRLGRVLGGNAQANSLFQWEKYPSLPQSMLVFHRNHEWLKRYQDGLASLPDSLELPEMLIHGRVLKPRLVSLGKDEALLLCMDVTEYVQLQRRQKSLLANLMHDLKTPLTSLLGYARSIEAFADDKALRHEAASVIAKEAKHINVLMNTMLTLEQIEHHSSHGASCDVSVVCRQVWDSLQPALEAKSISLHLSLPENKQVMMFEADCHRILMNVAENAIKFSPDKSMISCTLEDESGLSYVRIQDEGCGIAVQHLSQVTERFYRVDDARSRQQQGFGLGLAIVKEILERDGGSLSLENAHEGGLLVSMGMVLEEGD